MKKLLAFVLFLPLIAVGQILEDESLIAFYPFNGNANDESAYENNGEVFGAILTTDRQGNENSAYEFDGASTYISIPNSDALQSPTTELTQIAWINIFTWGSGGFWGPVLMKSNLSSYNFQYRLSVGTNGINTAINNWDNAVNIMDTLLFEEWYMIASTLKDDTVRTYVNGEFIGEGILTGPISPDNKPLEIGRDVPGSTETFHGKIDDIYIFNRSLSPTEIQNLYFDYTWVQENNSASGINVINYPNPFSASTTLKFDLYQPSSVQLTIYDYLGKQIEVIEKKQGQGKQQIVWNAVGLPAGVYYYRLLAGKQVAVGKMVLMN